MKFGRTDYDERIVDTANKIPQDEPVFFLRGSDALAPSLLLEWAKQLRLNGGDPEMARSAEDHAQSMIDYQRLHGKKTPDMYRSNSGEKNLILSMIKDLFTDDTINYTKLIELVSKYYGCTPSDVPIYTLMSADLRPGYRVEQSGMPTSLDDFNLDDEDKLAYHNSKLAIYINKHKEYSIIKNEIF